ncbi:MAG: SPOR domain-containing protein [Burkholderiales bacterium]
MKLLCMRTTLAAIAIAAGSTVLAAQPSARTARSAPGAVVEAVQMPAWVERDGARIPASAGMVLKEHDRLRTGADSRLLLRTADGSGVKLGEKASLLLESMPAPKDNVFQAAMKVSEGAFRFTTELLARYSGKREINISIGTVTAGIRGTDLWGKSEPERQIVCLIEGKIDVTPPGESAISMDDRLSFYVRDKGISQPVAPVPLDQLKQWSEETEMQPGQGVSMRGGKWKVTAASVESLDAALGLSSNLRDAGFAAEIYPAKVKDKRVYSVRLSGFASKQDAESVATALKREGRLGENDPKVGR